MTARKAQVAFVSAILLLMLSGIAALLAFRDLRRGETLVGHTHAVKESISDIESLGARFSRSMLAYVLSGDERFFAEYQANIGAFPGAIERLQQLTADNPVQRTHTSRLMELMDERSHLWNEALDRGRGGVPSRAEQESYAARSVALAATMAEVTRNMKHEEEGLLGQRMQSADRLFRLTLAIIVSAFAGA